MKKVAVVLSLSLIFTVPLNMSPAVAKSKCSKTELKNYEKAKYQVILNNTLIQMSLDLKSLIGEKYAGSLRDYQPQDIYRLQKADSDLAEDRASRASWEPTLAKLAKKCGFKMTSRSELLPEYYNN